MFRFHLGKGLVKARKDSENTSRAILQQVSVKYTEDTFEEAKKSLSARIERDIRAELTHLAALYRRYIIGAAGSRNRPQGTLDTVAKGSGAPKASLYNMLPSWAPRGSTYLEDKRSFIGNKGWFDNTGAEGWYSDAGYLRKAFAPVGGAGAGPSGGGGRFDGTTTLFESMFGPISVQVLRNNRGVGSNVGVLRSGSGKRMKLQLASIRVRALGQLTPNMMNATGVYNHGLMSLVRAYDPALAFRLGGRETHYRPSLEPFLKFFMEQSMGHALTQRIEKGDLQKTLFRRQGG